MKNQASETWQIITDRIRDEKIETINAMGTLLSEAELDKNLAFAACVQAIKAADQMIYFALRDKFEPDYARQIQAQCRLALDLFDGLKLPT